MRKAINDFDSPLKPSWVVLNKKALTGNILITGSIGSGKSQGTILPYFEQILANFTFHPAVLAIDPKNTFIPIAQKIALKNGKEKSIVHMCLEGKETFNPIFFPRALKNGKFLEAADMVKSASLNFLGKSGSSPFWDISSYNLIKNSLVICAATLDYYTLKDLYKTMINTATKDYSKILGEKLRDDSFDEEEKFNISCARDFFASEFEQFDEKVKSGILATSTAFLNQFQEFGASKIFCPPKDGLTIKSMDEIIDKRKILLFDISNDALAKSMGTFIKLHFQKSLLSRLKSKTRDKRNFALILIDEYQDVVTTAAGSSLGDERFMAKSREANAITIVATQSLISLQNSIGSDKSAKELFQNFRTRILNHSSDLETIKNFKELAGKEDVEKVSHSISELSQKAERNLMLGGFDIKDANISESYSTSKQKEDILTGKEFSSLKTFESYAQIYDGVQTYITKLLLKPHFLKNKATPHKDVLDALKSKILCFALLLISQSAMAMFPNVCTLVKSSKFMSCLNFKVAPAICGSWPPRPCAKISYYVPTKFIEVVTNKNKTFFGSLPGTALQLGKESMFGAESDNGAFSYQSHILTVPLSSYVFDMLPCGGTEMDKYCFDAQSEHIDTHWKTGSGDRYQPLHLAWASSPKACLIKGAIVKPHKAVSYPTYPGCSMPKTYMKKFPPSLHAACTPWGFFYPRYGTHHGENQVQGALMIASRMKSLGNEVFNTVPSNSDEKWQMSYPQYSSCFKQFEHTPILQNTKGVSELKRVSKGRNKDFLFATWKKVSCVKDWAEVASALAMIAVMKGVCQGL